MLPVAGTPAGIVSQNTLSTWPGLPHSLGDWNQKLLASWGLGLKNGTDSFLPYFTGQAISEPRFKIRGRFDSRHVIWVPCFKTITNIFSRVSWNYIFLPLGFGWCLVLLYLAVPFLLD